jgi:fucose 4-O-acetylase-like acetyltransferase
MNTIRMFAFVAAVLITALLLRVITYGLTVPQSIHAVAGAGIAAGKQSTAD